METCFKLCIFILCLRTSACFEFNPNLPVLDILPSNDVHIFNENDVVRYRCRSNAALPDDAHLYWYRHKYGENILLARNDIAPIKEDYHNEMLDLSIILDSEWNINKIYCKAIQYDLNKRKYVDVRRSKNILFVLNGTQFTAANTKNVPDSQFVIVVSGAILTSALIAMALVFIWVRRRRPIKPENIAEEPIYAEIGEPNYGFIKHS